ncbi:hypothetical protein [Azospirillum palustre]
MARDKGEAVRWFRRAADQGDTNAQKILGTMGCIQRRCEDMP